MDSLGLMLPYSGLHYLLFDHLEQPLILTSSNLSGQPITTKKEEQFVKYILSHNRKIINPIDDSVVKILLTKKKQTAIIRKSRGYTPKSFQVPTNLKTNQTILSLGAEENNTFSIYTKGKIYTSQYLGNCKHQSIISHYQAQLNKWLKMLNVKPNIILHDQHPSFNTTKLAKKISNKYQAKRIDIQHHTAHAYSVMIKHRLAEHLAIVCDGVGYSQNKEMNNLNEKVDNKLWGGEVFHIKKEGKSIKRIASLEPQLLLGGDTAVKKPTKMLFSILQKTTKNQYKVKKILDHFFSKQEQQILSNQYKTKINSFYTTSTGRILDGASALLNLCNKNTYHGRPALILESKATKPYPIKPVIDTNQLLTTPLFEYLIANLNKDNTRLAATVFSYLAKGFYQLVKDHNLPFTFSGGVAYNNQITHFLTDQGGMINKEIPCGDGGISFGQISYYLYQYH